VVAQDASWRLANLELTRTGVDRSSCRLGSCHKRSSMLVEVEPSWLEELDVSWKL